MAIKKTPLGHGKCATHKVYLLTCAQYEQLREESGDRCQICGFAAERMPQRRLYIDHNYIAPWAVRGLLCIRCNSGIGSGRQRPPDGAAEYLENAWFSRMLRDRGISPDPKFKPSEGTVILDADGARWTCHPAGHWTSDRGDHARNWRQIFRRFGPRKLRAVPRDATRLED